MVHYSWDPESKRFKVYYNGKKIGNMWWESGELFFNPWDSGGGNSVLYKEIYELMEQIEYEQFSK